MNQLLYGFNPEENIVAVHPSSDHSMRIYKRIENKVITEETDYYPFFYLSNTIYLKDFTGKHWIKELEGKNYFRYLAAFSSWTIMWEAIHFCINRYNQTSPVKISAYSELSVLHFRPDQVVQFLKQTGRTLFKGMQFSDLHRLQLDIKTFTKQGFKSSNAQRSEDRILVAALRDNRGFQKVLSVRRKHEKDILQELIDIIINRDPDVIEGYNIINYVLPYIASRCELNGIELSLGRDRSTPRFTENRFSAVERASDYFSIEIDGRQVIDILHILQFHGDKRRSLPDYTLKSILSFYGLTKTEREYLSSGDNSSMWEYNSNKIIEDCKNNVDDIDRICSLLSPKLFQLTQMVPFNYGAVSRTSITNKIESIVLREYLRTKYSIPKSSSAIPVANNYEEVYYSGVFETIVCLDIEQLYPKIMMEENVFPRYDELNIFQNLLNDFFAELKHTVNLSNNNNHETDSIYSPLISTFYPYIGNPRALFNDYTAYDIITKKSIDLIGNLISTIKINGGTTILVEPGRVYFIPPSDILDEKDVLMFTHKIEIDSRIGKCLSVNSRYSKMFLYKKRNHALLTYDGKIILRGSALTSRSNEPFVKSFNRQCIDAIFQNDYMKLHMIYTSYRNKLITHTMPIKLLAKSDNLRESITEYLASVDSGQRNRSTGYEVAIASGIHWNPGEYISYYIRTEEIGQKEKEEYKRVEEWDPNSPDENTNYYLKRIDDLTKKFELLFNEKDFHKIFSDEDLFGFIPGDIKLNLQIMKPELQTEQEEEPESFLIEPRIWLDEESSP
jgi:DNA polymerase, archaea type